jgi:archaellum biogenesis ATPase FlaH
MDIWERFSSDVKIAKIQKWLSAPDPAVNFQEALKLREANTGLWLLNSDIFKRWKDKDSFLWLHGIPGCGKTILSSTLLESLLKQTSDSPATAVAYFYFDFSDKQKQDTTSMIRSFISQLLKLSMKVSGSLHGLYFTSRNGQRPPSLFALLEVLKQLIKEFQRTYIIIDALDECNTRRELMSTIEDMSTWQLQGLHVLFTSRREPDIEEALGCILDGKNILGIQTEAVDHDIQLYVRQRLSIEAGLRWKLDVDDAVKHQIEISLKKGAHGMYTATHYAYNMFTLTRVVFVGLCVN